MVLVGNVSLPIFVENVIRLIGNKLAFIMIFLIIFSILSHLLVELVIGKVWKIKKNKSTKKSYFNAHMYIKIQIKFWIF